MLSAKDPQIFDLIEQEARRQEQGLEMIASENYCSPAVMLAQGSVLTNKYAEGYPGKRYYDGCHVVDQVEALAIERLKTLFGADFANVQPHSGSNANFTAYLALCQPGDKILGMDLSQGGHLTHGSPVNFSGKFYQFFHYGLDPKTERIDFSQVESLLKTHRPKLVVAGASSYPRQIDFKVFAQLCEQYQALLLVDMAHIAGLVAAGLHPSPIPYAQVVTSTTHKTLRGPRGGIILGQAAWEKPINSCLFPGSQGGPLEHVIAAKAVAFHEAQQDSFKQYQQQVITNAQTLAHYFVERGLELVTGGTDNHLLLLKTPSLSLTGKEASLLLDEVGITCNKNMIPGDKNSPFVTSGLRLGTPALTSRGMKATEMKQIGQMIVERLQQPTSASVKEKIAGEVKELCRHFPLYAQNNV